MWRLGYADGCVSHPGAQTAGVLQVGLRRQEASPLQFHHGYLLKLLVLQVGKHSCRIDAVRRRRRLSNSGLVALQPGCAPSSLPPPPRGLRGTLSLAWLQVVHRRFSDILLLLHLSGLLCNVRGALSALLLPGSAAVDVLLEGQEEAVQDVVQLSFPLLLLLHHQRLAARTAATRASSEDVSGQSLRARVVCWHNVEAHHHFVQEMIYVAGQRQSSRGRRARESGGS